jgi:hypothetical protein
MTRTGALLWKEWRDHRVALAVFAAIVPLVSWPVQRWVFKFMEPEWTWKWVVPLCAGLAVAIVASDLFAMDLATARMSAFVALPVPVRRHFTARTAFLAAVAIAFAAWTVVMNAALVGIWGKPGAAAALVGSFDPAFQGLAMSAAALAGVLVFSALGVGGFRAVIGGVLLAGIGYAATMFTAEWLLPRPVVWSPQPARDPLQWLVTAGVLLVAAYAGFVGGRAHAAGRRRGALIAAAIIVAAFGTPSGTLAWKAYRSWVLVASDPDIVLQYGWNPVSPDGRYVAVWANKPNGGCRSWVVRVADGALFDWPRRNEGIGGWTTDGLAWVGSMNYRGPSGDYGRFVRPETGATVERALVDGAAMSRRLASGWGAGPRWAQWLRYESQPARPASKGVYPTVMWRLWEKDGAGERTIEGRMGLAPTPRVGEALLVTPDAKLALVRLAGGEPTIVWNDATGIGWWTAGSPDGRYFTLSTSKGWIVLDSTKWTCVAGPYEPTSAYWCLGDETSPTLAVAEAKSESLTRLLEFPSGREIVPDASLGILSGYGSVQRLPDGGFIARAGTNRLLRLDADGKFIRRLFPPEE